MRASNAGFTLVEMMIVVVIISILAMIAAPSFTRDSVVSSGAAFASEVAMELRRARMQAVTERLPVWVTVFSDRIETRRFVPGTPPTMPLLTDSAERRVTNEGRTWLTIVDFNLGRYSTAPSTTPSINPLATHGGDFAQIIFTSNGGMRCFEDPDTSPVTENQAAALAIYNDQLPGTSTQKWHTITIRPLTGFAEMQTWPNW